MPSEHRDPHGHRSRDYHAHSSRSNRSRSPRAHLSDEATHSRRPRSRSPSRSPSRSHKRDRHRSRDNRDSDRRKGHRFGRPQKHKSSDGRSRTLSSFLHKHDQPPSLSKETPQIMLPFEARQLGRRDFRQFLPMLAYYLDIQKQKDITTMDKREAKGRWKSFMGKWNRGELAEGWYDPVMFQRSRELFGDDPWLLPSSEDGPDADGASASVVRSDDRTCDISRDRRSESAQKPPLPLPEPAPTETDDNDSDDDDDDDDDDMGPAPAPLYRGGGAAHGARVPGINDLEMRDEQRREDYIASVNELRNERRLNRRIQKERLEDLVPRTDPGSRERKLEKKAEIREKLRSASPGAAQEVDDSALMGSGDSIVELKNMKEIEQRKKSEREKRREEIWRAREEERLERLREYREREKTTVRMLREFARSQAGYKI